MAKSKAYMDMYNAKVYGIPRELAGGDGPALGKEERVTSRSLTKQEARQLEADYNWQYERGMFEDGEDGYIYQSDYLYLITCYGFDDFRVKLRWRLL